MERPLSVVTFTVVSLLFGLGVFIMLLAGEPGTAAMAVGIVLGLLWILCGLGLFLGDEGARVGLLWLFGFAFVLSIYQLWGEMSANGFAWLQNGVGLRELFEATRFVLAMTALYHLSGPSAIAFCRGKKEAAAPH